MSSWFSDFRFAVRTLVRSPGFAVISVLTLALGIGANTAIFSVVKAVVLTPLPYAEPDRLLMIWNKYASLNMMAVTSSVPDYYDRVERSESLENLAAFTQRSFDITGDSEPVRVQGAVATASFFPTLGMAPLLGRTFTEEEDQPGQSDVVVIAHGFWQRQFGGADDVLGRTIRLNGTDHKIIGVMPAGFENPWFFDWHADLWKPIAFTPAQKSDDRRGNEFLGIVARMKPGVALSQVAAEMDVIAAGVLDRFPDRREHLESSQWGATVVSLHEQTVGKVRPALLMLLGAVGLILVIACANVANLLLARATVREKEVAVRAAMGASRWQLLRLFLTESLLLSLIGGLAALIVLVWGMDLLKSFLPASLPRVDELVIDLPVLLFTFGLAVATGLLFGSAPAWLLSTVALHTSLKEGSRSLSGSSRRRLRSGLVVAEVALSLILLVGAGLLTKSFLRLRETHPGFHAEQRLAARITLPQSRYTQPQQRLDFSRQLLAAVESIPGVQTAGLTTNIPLDSGMWTRSFRVEGQEPEAGEPQPNTQFDIISPDYLRTMGIRLIKGRDFNELDTADTPSVLLVDETVARRYWPNADPIGQRIDFYDDDEAPKWRTVVGVVEHVKRSASESNPGYQIYCSQTQIPVRHMHLIAHTKGEPLALAKAIRRQVSQIDSELPLDRIRTMHQIRTASIAQPRFNALLLGLFSLGALILSAIGIYGVQFFSVNQRTNEIGVRMALGAKGADVIRLVVGEGLKLSAMGVVLGLIIALIGARLLTTMLYEISPVDPGIYGGVAFFLLSVAVAASYVPARRATRVDPMVALRCE